jgi:hypothetical protein
MVLPRVKQTRELLNHALAGPDCIVDVFDTHWMKNIDRRCLKWKKKQRTTLN